MYIQMPTYNKDKAYTCRHIHIYMHDLPTKYTYMYASAYDTAWRKVNIPLLTFAVYVHKILEKSYLHIKPVVLSVIFHCRGRGGVRGVMVHAYIRHQKRGRIIINVGAFKLATCKHIHIPRVPRALWILKTFQNYKIYVSKNNNDKRMSLSYLYPNTLKDVHNRPNHPKTYIYTRSSPKST